MQAINQQSRRERLAAYRRNPFSLFLAALASAAVFCRSNFSESPSRAGFPAHIVRRALYRNPTFGI